MLLSGCTGSAREASDRQVSQDRSQLPHASSPGEPQRQSWLPSSSAPLRHPPLRQSSTLTGPHLVGSELDSRFPLHQSCADLHNHRLDGVGAAPALRDTA